MTWLALIRHGSTEWNEKGLVQGHSDVPLSDRGRAEVARWRLPPGLAGFAVVSSPLSRAVETARLVAGEPAIEPRLIEMDWGAWEGRTLPELRAELGDLMTAWEAEGLHFRAPGGESPSQVQGRLQPWLIERANRGQATLAVCHKGVIRALYALATGWDMTDKPPHKFREPSAQLFSIADDGHPAVARLNISLVE
ncbi:MAG: histidine phosphatase family protein [Kiloniellales bacterium]